MRAAVDTIREAAVELAYVVLGVFIVVTLFVAMPLFALLKALVWVIDRLGG